ncbi:hypothetical protein R3P38DRAFT_3245117 [Favolaschia claudopus]|uniref:Uncharacterized protein n=1 Tax=Favolaschia claudopus TaxID=2862362 RepID=A0AAV9Z115_9AGAR
MRAPPTRSLTLHCFVNQSSSHSSLHLPNSICLRIQISHHASRSDRSDSDSGSEKEDISSIQDPERLQEIIRELQAKANVPSRPALNNITNSPRHSAQRKRKGDRSRSPTKMKKRQRGDHNPAPSPAPPRSASSDTPDPSGDDSRL